MSGPDTQLALPSTTPLPDDPITAAAKRICKADRTKDWKLNEDWASDLLGEDEREHYKALATAALQREGEP